MVFLSDMSSVWAEILKELKEKNVVAFTAASSVTNIEFTNDEIILYVTDAATNELLKKYLPKHVKIVFSKELKNNDKIEYLKSILGDKLVIK